MARNIPVLKVDSDVPIPVEVNQPSVREQVPIDKLKVGESVEFPRELTTALATTASRLKKQGKVFTIRKVTDDKARIWRVA